VDTKKIVNIRSLTSPSIACESEREPALQQELQQEFESNEVRVSLLVDVDEDTVCPWGIFPKRIFARRSPDSARESEGIPRKQALLLPACYNDSTTVRAREALALSFVDEDLAPQVIPERIYTRKPCTSACERPSVSSLTFGKVFPATNVASLLKVKEEVLNAGACQESTSNRGPHPQSQEDRGRACPLCPCARSRSPVLHFPCIRPYATRGNEEGRCLLQQPPEQEDTRSSPSSLMVSSSSTLD